MLNKAQQEKETRRRKDMEHRMAQMEVAYPIAAVSFSGALTGTNPPNFGSGIRNITRTGTGAYLISFNEPEPDDRYIVLASGSNEGFLRVHTKTNANFSLTATDKTSTALDNTSIDLVVWRP